MKQLICALLTTLGSTMSIFASPIVPTADGTTWSYSLTEEAGEGLRIPGLPAEEKICLPVAYRISGQQNVDGAALLKFEMHRANTVTNTDLLKVDDSQIVCFARINASGELTKMNPPQTIVPPRLEKGARWDYDAEIGDTKVHQHFAIIDAEDVDLRAGKFRAFKIHMEQTEPNALTEDRWFVKGIGIVKDVTTTRTSDGNLIHRVTLELMERPKIAPRPEVRSTSSTKTLSATVSGDAVGAATTRIGAGAEKIYARWQGNGLRKDAKIRVVWIAENIGEIAPPGYTIDEATTTATAPDAHGNFTLSRPDDGWAPGDYRVEFYVDDALAETVKLKIAK